MAKYRRTKFGMKKSVGYGFVGKWRDGTLGWCLPKHLAQGNNTPDIEPWNQNEKAVLCKITVEKVMRKDGREIAMFMREPR